MLTKRQRKGIRRGAVLPLTLAWVGLVGAALGFLPQIDVCAPPPFLDADRDGVINPLDRCPNTPADADVDVRGCAQSQLDDDADGVMNDVDQCANTPAGETADATGCSCTQLDSDNDGVDDCDDLCPGTAEGATVDADGCADEQLDDDGDGVANGVDMCSNTPEGETVDADGCSESQLDDDADGVMNNVDQCADTPEGEAVDADGCSCSQLDADNDGVNDCDDLCADTPEGTEVNDDGCPTTAFTVSAGSDLTASGGDVLTVSATVTNAEGTVTYAWTADDSGLTDGTVGLADDTTATVTVTLSADAAGSVDLTVTATNGDADATTASDTITITVGAAPLSVTISGPAVATGGQTITLTAVAPSGEPPISFWWHIKSPGTAGSAPINPASGIGQTIQVTFSNDAEGTFIFEVLATDNTGATVDATKNIDVTPTATVISFTTDVDTLTGTSLGDTFIGLVKQTDSTFEGGDSADGAGGDDQLKVTASSLGADTTTSGVSLQNIEDVLVRNVDTAHTYTLDTTLFEGVETLWTDRSLNAVLFQGMAEIVNLGVNNTDEDLRATFDNDALTGTSDEVTVFLQSAQDTDTTNGVDIVVASDGTDGFETVILNSGGTEASAINSINDLDEDDLVTLMIEGTQALTIGAVADTLTTIDASGLSAAVDVDASACDHKPGLAITLTASDDALRVNGAGTSAQTWNGGDGTDTLYMTLAGGANNLSKTTLSNFEYISAFATAPATINLDRVATLTEVRLASDATAAGVLTLTKVDGFPVAFVGNGEADEHQDFNDLVYQLDDASGDNDSLAIGVNNDGTTLDNNRDLRPGAITAAGIEDVTITVEDGAAIFGNATFAALESLTITGPDDVTIIVADTSMGGGTASVTIDCADVQGDLGLTVSDGAAGDTLEITGAVGDNTITTGASEDTITTGAGDDRIAGGAGVDTIDGGEGDDSIAGGAGIDNLTGGPGDDTFVYAENGAANVESIDDFQIDDSSGADDKISVDAEGGSPDLEACNSTDLTGGEAIVLVAHAINTNVNLSATATNVIRLTTVEKGTFAAAIGTGVITVADGANPLILWYDAVTGEAVLGSAVEGGGTDNAIDTADVFTEIVRFSVTTTEYGNFDGDNIQLH